MTQLRQLSRLVRDARQRLQRVVMPQRHALELRKTIVFGGRRVFCDDRWADGRNGRHAKRANRVWNLALCTLRSPCLLWMLLQIL